MNAREELTVEHVRRRAQSDANFYGYQLNYDPEFLGDLLQGLKKNEERFGYPLCPCRVGTGKFELDRDIICPCDYRDPDVAEYGACYCALYIKKEFYEKKLPINPVPERRPKEKQERAMAAITGEGAKAPDEKEMGAKNGAAEDVEKGKPAEGGPASALAAAAKQAGSGTVKLKLWYCRQCGYVVYREDAPYICPICKARREMFSELIIGQG